MSRSSWNVGKARRTPPLLMLALALKKKKHSFPSMLINGSVILKCRDEVVEASLTSRPEIPTSASVSDDALGWKLLTSPTQRLMLELRTQKRRKKPNQKKNWRFSRSSVSAEEPSAHKRDGKQPSCDPTVYEARGPRSYGCVIGHTSFNCRPLVCFRKPQR